MEKCQNPSGRIGGRGMEICNQCTDNRRMFIMMVIQLGILSWMQILALISWTRVCGPKDSPGGNTLDSARKPFGRE